MPDKLQQLRRRLIKKAKRQVQQRYAESDVHIIRAVAVLQDLDATFNLLAENAVEWYSAYFPELHQLLKDNEKYLQLVYLIGGRKGFDAKKVAEIAGEETAEKIAAAAKKSMGSEVEPPVLDAMKLLALNALNLREERKLLERLVEKQMAEYAPNLSQLAGAVLGARLLAAAGGLRQLALLPASTIQLLGAERALFRHMRNSRVKGPKHGLLYQHALVRSVPAKHKGKVARSVAAKLAIAAKADFFKSKERVSGRLQKELQQRVKQLQK